MEFRNYAVNRWLGLVTGSKVGGLLQDRNIDKSVYTLRFKDEDAGFPSETRCLE